MAWEFFTNIYNYFYDNQVNRDNVVDAAPVSEEVNKSVVPSQV